MKTISLFLLIAATSMLAACGPNMKRSDREWISVSCNGFANWDECNRKAKRFCPDGFDIGQKEESLIEQKRIMEFACKQ